jgi:predicted NACHT family NTPase
VLQGLLKYAPEHVLLVERPGSGKSTALVRLLLNEASKRKEQKIPVLVEMVKLALNASESRLVASPMISSCRMTAD